jgi:hypothetical protein
MAAIITDKLKRQLIDDLYADFQDSATYYFAGLGRAELWNDSDIVDTPTNSTRTVDLFKRNLQGVKQITDVSYTVPRYNWSSGTIYTAYDDNQAGYPTNAYYVITATNQVYICLQQGKNALGAAVASTVEPTSTSTSPVSTADGYIWKYLYTVTSFDASRFLAANFIPVKLIDSADDAIEELQKNVQDAAVSGAIGQIVVTSGGSGYASAPTVTIVGDGSSAAATATISAGAVTKVEVTNRGSGYTYANVKFSTGSATARVVLSPAGGFGADPRDDLKATALMFNSRPNDTELGALLIDQDFRQIGLIRNIKDSADGSLFNGSAANALRKLTFDPGATAFTNDTFVVGSTSGAKGFVDFADSAAGVFYHQNETTGFTPFQSGESLTAQNASGVTVTGAAVLDSDVPATVDKYTGDVLYIDNRSPISRSAGETQDIKIIVQL